MAVTMKNSFNLIDEPWVPVTDVGRASLRQLFSSEEYRCLGGNPVQKIALMKLLLAIAQAACTPRDESEWQELKADGLAEKCVSYLEKWYDRFYLYGERPFLQMPSIGQANIQSCGGALPEVATGNTTILSHIQMERALDDADKAVLVVTLMGFALGGKKADNSVVLTPGYRGKNNEKGKPSSAKPGPSQGIYGLLHSYLLGSTLQETLWINLLTNADITRAEIFTEGTGIPPWEKMPLGEDCPTAQALKYSLHGRLIPMSRFILLNPKGLHYSEGLSHDGHLQGKFDPTMTVNFSGKTPQALWVNPEKRPWRELTALLSFLDQQQTQGFQCLQLRSGLDRVRKVATVFGLWSGGLRVSSNAGEQYVSGGNDFVESTVWLQSDMLGSIWFAELKSEMTALEVIAKGLYVKVLNYFKEQNMDGTGLAAQASQLFWQLCERQFQRLVDVCGAEDTSQEERQRLRQIFAGFANVAYSRYCPRETARQLDAWAKCRPIYHRYLKQET